MAFVKGDVAVKQISPTRWRLLEPLAYKGRSQTFIVPKGFKTDFATVPKVFTWLVPPYGLYTKAAVLHDFLCVKHPVNRSDADGVFRRAMKELGVSFLRRWIMWAAVRMGCRFKDATLGEFLRWLVIAIPTLLFLAIPAVIVFVWLGLFWIAEYIVFAGLRPIKPHHKINKPSFLLGADALEPEKE